MYSERRWTYQSTHRNQLTSRFEPIQPFFLGVLAQQLNEVCFFDIGANVGFYSLALASLETVECVHGFEAVPETFHHLQKNVLLNSLQNKVECHNYALSNFRGNLPFRIFDALSGVNGVERQLVEKPEAGRLVDIPARRLDDEFGFEGQNVVLKIDVEGHESEVLAGAEQLLKNNRGFLQLEILPDNIAREEIEALLNDAGWRLMTHIGADYFFTNLAEFKSSSAVLSIMEKCHEEFLSDYRGRGVRPRRKGVSLLVALIYRKLRSLVR